MWIRRRYRKGLYIVGALVILALLLSGVNYWLKQKVLLHPLSEQEGSPVLPLELSEHPLSLDGYTKVKIGIAPGKIYLVDNCTALVMATSMSKTFTIQRGLEGALDIRPDAYDTTYDLMEHYDIGAKLVKIYQPKDGLYYAHLFTERDNKVLNLDTRPSDALALAARFKVPVYVQDSLLQTQSERVC